MLSARSVTLAFLLPLATDAQHTPQNRVKTATGAHSTGKAVDIAVSGEKALELIRVAQAHGIKRIGVQQSGTGRFIHLDVCTEEDGFPTPAIWSY